MTSSSEPGGSPTSSASPAESRSDALECYLDYLDRLRSGESIDFNAYCARRPELAGELVSCDQRFRALDAFLRDKVESKSVSARLRERYGAHGDPGIVLANPDGESPSEEALHRLEERRDPYSRYELKGELARGGMGAILRVWDEDLHRTLAMKVVLGKSSGGDTPAELPPEPQQVARFLEEAQVTGQLDHPGIVPVHELGIDDQGGVYFTMRLVKGRELRRIFELVRTGAEGWNATRAVSVLLRVCEAMAYAHSRGVLHRDLKPANIMVGRFGETYVMDWGLSRVMDRAESKDVRLRGEPATVRVETDRAAEHQSPHSPFVTMDGDIIGTPAYMSPEQAQGKIEDLTPASDVYAVGAMLYELLAGHAPFANSGEKLSPFDTWRLLTDGPPTPLERLASEAPPELVAISERAMAREPGARYPDMLSLAGDLRAYLENRVVRAHRTGPIVELKKWVRRNRGTAAALAALLLVVGSSGFALMWRERMRSAERERFSLEQSAAALVAETERLWPIAPELVPRLEAWLELADDVAALAPSVRAGLGSLAKSGTPVLDGGALQGTEEHALRREIDEQRARSERVDADLAAAREQLGLVDSPWRAAGRSPEFEIQVLEAERARLASHLATLESASTGLPRVEFNDAEQARRYLRDAQLLETIGILTAEPYGLIERMSARLAQARSLEPVSIGDHQNAWESARARIRADPRYGGLDLTPQIGLAPIGVDPESGLWEFWHVLSGERPVRGADGRLDVTGDTGIVLVLIPGGEFAIGAQSDDSAAPNFDSRVRRTVESTNDGAAAAPIYPVEGPVHRVALDAYFLSKYELTQGQWLRLTGDQPCEFPAGNKYREHPRLGFDNPLDSASWAEAERVLAEVGLELPTESRWEYAARGGTSTPYWFGNAEAAAGRVNFADFSAAEAGMRPSDGVALDDGYYVAAPVDALEPNAFGLHHVHGNVSELVLDRFFGSYSQYSDTLGRNGEHVVDYSRRRGTRGGSFLNTLADCRVSQRLPISPSDRVQDVGVRPARSISP